MGDLPVNKVCVCGWLQYFKQSRSWTEFYIDDGSGSLKCGIFEDTLCYEDFEEQFVVGDIVRVVGQIKDYRDERSMSVFEIKKITLKQELDHHVRCYYHIINHYELGVNQVVLDIRNLNEFELRLAADNFDGFDFKQTAFERLVLESITQATRFTLKELYEMQKPATIIYSQHLSKNCYQKAIKWMIEEGQIYQVKHTFHVVQQQELIDDILGILTWKKEPMDFRSIHNQIRQIQQFKYVRDYAVRQALKQMIQDSIIYNITGQRNDDDQYSLL